MENQETILLQIYLTNNLKILKDELGSNCTYLSYLTTKKKNDKGEYQPMYGVKAKLKNDKGGFDKVEVGFQKEFRFFEEQEFDQILETLQNRTYGNPSQATV